MASVKMVNHRYGRLAKEPVTLSGSFVAAGAGAVTDRQGELGRAGTVVRRLITAGATPFFRVTWPERIATLLLDGPMERQLVVNVSGKGIAELDNLTFGVHYGPLVGDYLTATPADPPKLARDIDVVVFNAGTPVDTAGLRISVQLDYDRVPSR